MLFVIYRCRFHKHRNTMPFFGKQKAVLCDQQPAISSTVNWGA